jgi:hypothetical protein
METAQERSITIGEQAEEVVRRARAVGEELGGLASAIGGVATAVQSKLDVERRLKEEPLKTLLIAAGVGYLAGGGVFTSTTARLLRVGARLWLIPAINRKLVNRSTNTTTNRQEYH